MPKITFGEDFFDKRLFVEALFDKKAAGARKLPDTDALKKCLNIAKLEELVQAAVDEDKAARRAEKDAQMAERALRFNGELRGFVSKAEVTEWSQTGALMTEGRAEYYYGPRDAVYDEIDCEWRLGVSIDEGDGECHADIDAHVYQDQDVGDDKVMIDQEHVDITITEDFSDKYPLEDVKNALRALFSEEEVAEPMRGKLLDHIDALE